MDQNQKEVRNFKNDKQELTFLEDFTVIVDGKIFKTHKFLLAYRSEYFKAMLSHDTIENRENRVEIKEIKSKTMENILEYFYTSKLIINKDNINDLLEAGNRFQFKSVLALCDKYLLEVDIHAYNCLAVLTAAYRFNMECTIKRTLIFVAKNINQIFHMEEYLRLSKDVLLGIVSTEEETIIYNGFFIFKAIIKWVQHDPEERSKCVDDIISCINLDELPIPQLLEIGRNEIIGESITLLKFVQKAKDKHLENYAKIKKHSGYFNN